MKNESQQTAKPIMKEEKKERQEEHLWQRYSIKDNRLGVFLL